MPDKKKILAIIPARGGSKGIPKKNIVLVGGKPLIAWTIEAAKKSKYINRIVVSSDSDEILSVAAKYGAEPIKRPAELATDTAPPEPLVHHALKYLKDEQKYAPDVLVYLQATSPLRDYKDIDSAFDIFLRSKATSAISAYELDKKYLKTFISSKNGFLKGVANNEFPFMNRQLLPNIYMPNGAIYIIMTKAFKKLGRLLSDKTLPYIMSLEKSIDIDNPEDLKKLRLILKRSAFRKR